MADFCNKCAEEHGFPTPDIDIPKLFDDLIPETYFPVICEGCSMLGVGKNEDGELILNFLDSGDGRDGQWVKSDINEYKYKTKQT